MSRLASLREHAGCSVLPLELSSSSKTYAWRVNERSREGVVTVFGDRLVDAITLRSLFFRLRDILSRERVDVFFAPSYWPAYSLVAVLAAKSLGIRVVFMGDSHYASGSNRGVAIVVKRLLIKLYDSALVAGSLHRSFLRHLGMPIEKIFDGYDTVDNDHFKKIADQARLDDSAYRGKFNLPEKYILSLGRFVSKKNLETVLNAYVRLVANGAHNGHDLVFVGSGPVQTRLRELAHSRGLAVVEHQATSGTCAASGVTRTRANRGRGSLNGVVHFYPFAQIETVPVYYALATAFVLASTTDEWGLVVNEAMACSCPVVVSRSVGSSLDLVVPGVTGYRFVADNVHELAWCLEKLCNDTAYAQRLGRQACEHIGAWSNDRFARNALRAAQAALAEREGRPKGGGAFALDAVKTACSEQPAKSRTGLPFDDATAVPTVWFMQTCFPDYRMPVFSRLHERLGASFHLFSGTSYFTPDIKTTPDFLDWHSLVENRFLGGRRFLWQTGACEAMFQAEVVVMELNPRIFSNWVVLAARALWGAPTLLWGHAWSRDDRHSLWNIWRLYMMRLASGTITYTRTQRDEVRRVFPRFDVFAATNSLICASECQPQQVGEGELDTILYVGRINPPKKVDLLIDAFLNAQLPAHTKLKIVGSGNDRERLESSLATRANAANRVLFLGHVQNHEILRSLYATAFCAVSPGYVGLGAIQTFSFGVPLILADKEPHAPEVEACHEGENTVYFEANNVISLTTALERMWRDRAKWLAQRSQLAAWTAANYSVEAMVEGFIEAIDAVTGSRCAVDKRHGSKRP